METKEENADLRCSGLTRLDVSANIKLEVLDCTGNPLKFIKSRVPGSSPGIVGGVDTDLIRRESAGVPEEDLPAEALASDDMIILEAAKGGSVGLRYSPREGQTYYAYPDEGYRFGGWFDVLGDRLSLNEEWTEEYGTKREIVAMFYRI